MDKTAARALEAALGRQRMHQRIKHVVADKGARRLRDLGRDTGSPAGLQHGLDGQAAEVGRRPARHHRRVDGLAAVLSGMRASLTLMATRSSEIAPRPPAWPTQITSAGLCSFSKRMSSSAEVQKRWAIAPP
jgi:hypothetical protein